MTSDVRSENLEQRAFEEEIPYPSEEAQLAPKKPTFAGLDMDAYPGEHAMDEYKNAGFSIICAYLANKPGRIHGGGNRHWIDAVPKIVAKGWGLAPTYLGAQASLGGSWTPDHPVAEAGIDAIEAVSLAKEAKLEKGQTIFLDVEAPFSVGSAQESYVLKWLEDVQAAGFKTAIYCFPGQIEWAKSCGINIWTVHLNSRTGRKNRKTGKITWCELPSKLPSDPIDIGAVGTQGRFYCHGAGRKDEIDYDRWIVPDPSKM